jgi:hypothetical protein
VDTGDLRAAPENPENPKRSVRHLRHSTSHRDLAARRVR